MGFLDSIKGMSKGKKSKVTDGIDKGADVVGDKVGAEHADKVDMAAEKAKDAVDKIPE